MADHQPANWKLFCAVVNKNIPFQVKIQPDATVDELKKAIKLEKQREFDGFAAHRLTLFKINVPAADRDKALAAFAANLPSTPMNPLLGLNTYFLDAPPRETVHILVQTPDIPGGSKRKRSSSDIDEIEDPLQLPPKLRPQMDPPSKAGTPGDTAIPLRLIHPIFGEFADDCNSFDPGVEEQDFVNTLFNMATIFDSEMDRQAFFNDALTEYFGMRLSVGSTDGHPHVIGSSTLPFIIFIVEGKNEFINNQTDPRFQVILYYREYVRALYQKHRALAASTRLPVILVTYFGPNLEVSGGITHPDGTIQSLPLTPWFRLDEDWYDSKNWTILAKCVGALKRALNALSDYYKRLPKSPVPSPVPSSTAELFPYPREYKEIEILNGDPPILSNTSRAPILYGLTNLPGGWITVIMEELTEPWIELLKIQPEDREPFRRPIKEAVDSLHTNGYVHGDIRASNIFACPSDLSQGIKFIDFDEVGKAGEAIYPRNLNVRDIKRPDGAVGGQKILKDHDLWMMEEIFVRVLT